MAVVQNDLHRCAIVVEALRANRLAHGLMQRQLAERIGRAQSWISKIEGSQRRVGVMEIIEITKALGVDPANLLAEMASRLP